MNTAASLSQENALLKQQLFEKETALKAKETVLKHKNDHIVRLEELLKQFQRKQFSSSSEKVSPDQLGLFNEPESIDALPEQDGANDQTVAVQSHQCTRKPRCEHSR